MRRIALALVLGLLSLPALAYLLLLPDAPDPREWQEHFDHGRVWLVSERSDAGRSWIVFDRYGDLRQGSLHAPAVLPPWVPPLPTGPDERLRLGYLAVGWPLRCFVAAWEDRTDLKWLPPAAEIDEDGQSMDRASAELRRPSNWGNARVLPANAAIDALLGAAAWWVVLTAIAAVWRARRSREAPRHGNGG
ncbi:MAG: hypothetical protein KDA22_09125 [Phycisphaerales bacterium]|nr:hypothetical protein [Phycisphaerales bacterium]